MIKLIKPYITFDEVRDNFFDVFDSGWFTKGKYVDLFSSAIKDFTSAEFSFLTTSATTALSIALRAVNISAGDEVVVSDFSFPATANVVEDLEATPIFADVDLETFNMTLESLEQKLTNKTKAVIFVDCFGNPSGLHAISELCRTKNIPLIEDAACAMGSEELGERCGSISDITCFSFHPRKLITTGEGGAITTNNPEYADKIRVKLNHGAFEEDGRLEFVDFGYNYRMSELQAAMGAIQMTKIKEIILGRNEVRNEYISRLEKKGFIPQSFSANVTSNVQSLVFRVPANTDRNKLIAHLREEGIESTLGTYCLSAQKYYRDKYSSIQSTSLKLQERTLTLPCYKGVDVDYITESILSF